MTPTQETPPAPPLLGREHSIRTADNGEIDRFVAEVYATMEPALIQHHFINPEFRINLALHEAVINAWRHGNRKDPGKTVTVRWRVKEHLVLEVMDQGAGFDFQALKDPRTDENIRRSNGRGIAIIIHLADHVSWQDQGRHLIASFRSISIREKKKPA